MRANFLAEKLDISTQKPIFSSKNMIFFSKFC